MENKFEILLTTNVNSKVEQKSGLNYLSWSFAWSEFKKVYPDATYKVIKQENGLPYVCDNDTGYMVFTEVTADGLTHEMWLFVMNGANKAMKSKPYDYEVKDWQESKKQNKEIMQKKKVESATMFDINKTIMRCLVKNLAMFGLGLYIYAGEDLPEESKEQKDAKKHTIEHGTELFDKAVEWANKYNLTVEKVKENYKFDLETEEVLIKKLK